ncbi:hypothetical protein Dimus_015902 [Dionaea muscipula]
MVKSKKSSSSSRPATRKSSQKTQKKSSPTKSPKQKVFKIIGEVRSNVGPELFKGITKLFPVGKNFSYSRPHESDSSVSITAKNVIAVSRKKNTEVSKPGTSSTTDVANVGEKEFSSEGTIGATQESQVVAFKGKSKPKTQRKRKRDMISPAIGENLVEVEDKEDDDETTQLDKVVGQEDQTEDVVTESVVTNKRRKKQVARTRPSRRSRKIKSSSEDIILPAFEAVGGEEEEKQEVRVVTDNSSPTAEELEKEEHKEDDPFDGGVSREETEGGEVPKASEIVEVEEDEEIEENVDKKDEAKVEEDEEEEEEDEVGLDSDDVLGKRPPTRKLHLGVLSKCRLRMPNRKMMKSEDGTGYDSSRARTGFDDKKHCLALYLVWSFFETFSKDGCNSKKNNRLMEELTSEKKEFIELATALDQLKADVVQVTEKNKTLEEENKELKAALEKEKEKVRTFQSRMDALREHNIVEKRNMAGARLPKQMDFMMKEAQREYLESDEFQGMFNLASALILRNCWSLGLAQVRRVLEENDPLIPVLDKMEVDVKV